MPLMCSPHHRPSPARDQKGPGGRTRVRRKPDRGRYDRDTIYRIVDEALFGHVGVVAGGLPYVTPMVIARRGDELLLHGSARGRLIRLLATECEVCVAVTHVDGLIIARSLFDSSLNYRSVVVFGKARPMTAPADKLGALQTIVEHVLPGRWGEARPPSERELRATAVLSVPLTEASAKVRSGPPQDSKADLGLHVWAGELPLRVMSLPTVADPLLADDIPLPASVARFGRFSLGPGPTPAASASDEPDPARPVTPS
jgi:nitroimidazol reductase NimA-like FMN-containing flavoprotein (pyridoxamine 5'-phosphate oxidase superfamily)